MMHPLRVLALWFVVAVAFVAAGGMTWLAAPFPQVVLGGLTAALFVCYSRRGSFRQWMDQLPTAAILGLHTVRFVGAYFLVLHARGELPYDFAVLGGWGDIVVAASALVLLAAYRGSPGDRSIPFQAWNLIGLIDIACVVGFAAKNAIADPESMAPLLRLPLGLLPTFVVPLIVFTHGVLMMRAFKAR